MTFLSISLQAKVIEIIKNPRTLLKRENNKIGFKEEKIPIEMALTFLKIIFDSKARIQKRFPQVIIRIELMVTSSQSKMIRPYYQTINCSTILKFMKLRYKRGNVIRTITGKIVIEKAQGSYVIVSGK